MKVIASSNIILRLLDLEMSFKVHINSLDNTLGEVLVQVRHPTAFEYRKLDKIEQWYSTHEKEMVIVIHCLMHWKRYLLGTKFVVVIDNVVNTCFKT